MIFASATGTHVAVWDRQNRRHCIYATGTGELLGKLPRNAGVVAIQWPYVAAADKTSLRVYASCITTVGLLDGWVNTMAFVDKDTLYIERTRSSDGVRTWSLLRVGGAEGMRSIVDGVFACQTARVSRVSRTLMQIGEHYFDIATGARVHTPTDTLALRRPHRWDSLSFHVYGDQSRRTTTPDDRWRVEWTMDGGFIAGFALHRRWPPELELRAYAACTATLGFAPTIARAVARWW